MAFVDIENFDGERGYIGDTEFFCYDLGGKKYMVESEDFAHDAEAFGSGSFYRVVSEEGDIAEARGEVVDDREIIEGLRRVVLEAKRVV